jgi:methionyl-tRNA formyltransferase
VNTLRIAFAGTPEFACPALEVLLASRHAVVGVLTQPDRPAGRGLELRASPVKLIALARGIEVDEPATLKTPESRARLAAWQPDLLVVVAYGLILPQAVLDIPRLGCLNIHGSLLPRWRGAAPIQRAILAADRETGVAIMRLEAGLDTGPVFLSRRIAIGEHATAGEVHDALREVGAAALMEVVDGLAAGTAVAVPQVVDGVTYAHKIEIRAFNPWPIAFTTLAGEPLRIHSASVGAAAGVRPLATAPGEVLRLEGDHLLVACGSGVLGITQLQRAGKRMVSAREFANAVPLSGLRFGA